jgi:hypothetical protein
MLTRGRSKHGKNTIRFDIPEVLRAFLRAEFAFVGLSREETDSLFKLLVAFEMTDLLDLLGTQ